MLKVILVYSLIILQNNPASLLMFQAANAWAVAPCLSLEFFHNALATRMA
jgi:hypothetical protein